MGSAPSYPLTWCWTLDTPDPMLTTCTEVSLVVQSAIRHVLLSSWLSVARDQLAMAQAGVGPCLCTLPPQFGWQNRTVQALRS